MQKTIIAVFAIILFSCKAEDKKESDTKGPVKGSQSDSSSLYPATYSSKFEMGDAKNVDALKTVWKAWDDGDLKAGRKHFADSMHFYLRDGNTMEGKTDSIMTGAQSFRDMYTTVKSTVHAILPLKSTDKNEHWVCVWGTEVSTDKQGKSDSVGLQETWRFNKDGKIDLMYQFGRSLVPVK